MLHALRSWREITTQRGLHVGRQIIEALSREHDWPGGQSDLPLGALGREGLPGLKVELLGKMYRQQPNRLLQSGGRDDQRDGVQVSWQLCFLPNVAEYVPSASLVNDP